VAVIAVAGILRGQELTPLAARADKIIQLRRA
jgi:hypothetical protein